MQMFFISVNVNESKKQIWALQVTLHLSKKNFKFNQATVYWHRTSHLFFYPAEQSEGNKISRLGCGLSVIKFHRLPLSTAGSRSYKHAAMSAHHPVCLPR